MPTFSFYCLACYNNLLRTHRIDISDYITYFQMSYKQFIHPDDCNLDTLIAIHSHFQHNLKVTDRPLVEILETILLLKLLLTI